MSLFPYAKSDYEIVLHLKSIVEECSETLSIEIRNQQKSLNLDNRLIDDAFQFL